MTENDSAVLSIINSFPFSEKEKTFLKDIVDYINNLQSSKSLKKDFESLIAATETSKILNYELNLGISPVAAAILYLSVSKELLLPDNIGPLFGKEISEMISDLIKFPELDKERYASNPENFINFLITISKDLRVILIKLAESLYKIRNIISLSKENQLSFASECSLLYAPLAHRLGLYKMKTEFEEISMKYSNPEMYKYISKRLNETKASRDKYINEFVSPINEQFKQNNFNFEIKGRPKSIYSIWNKMKKQKVDFDEVYDLFAIRIIIDCPIDNEKLECWRAYSVITDSYTPNPHRLRDWISSPKSSGYESLHTTVIGPENKWVEVQIRTKRMDEIAEKGIAAHWKYKGKESKSQIDKWLTHIRQQLDNPGQTNSTDSKAAKSALYTNEIFVFTPKGDLKKSYAGHTVLDFAFEVHTDIGARCTGAIVNNKFVSIRHELKNGDKVKIITSKQQKPKYEWLDFVKNPRVIAKIKKAIKAEEFKDLESGKEIVKQKLTSLKIEFNDENINRLVEFFDCKSAMDLYHDFGSGKTDVLKIKKAFKQETETTKELHELTTNEEYIKNIEKFQPSRLDYLTIENNLNTIDYQFARCCNPIKGDDIFGFVTISKGTKIHKQNCPNAKDLKSKYAYRIIRARWNDTSLNGSFLAHVRITGNDSVGVATTITQVISNEMKLKMKSVNVHEKKDGMFEGFIVMYVESSKQLEQVIDRLKNIKDVSNVIRVNK